MNQPCMAKDGCGADRGNEDSMELDEGQCGMELHSESGDAKSVAEKNYCRFEKPPRRPLSPYLFFSQTFRKVVRRERPGSNPSLVMKLVK